MSVPEQPDAGEPREAVPTGPLQPGGSPDFNSPDVNSPVPPPSHNGGRNPLALVVVAVVAAAMLYAGFHMARRSGEEPPHVLGKSTQAPNFTLETLDGKNMSLSDLRGQGGPAEFLGHVVRPVQDRDSLAGGVAEGVWIPGPAGGGSRHG